MSHIPEASRQGEAKQARGGRHPGRPASPRPRGEAAASVSRPREPGLSPPRAPQARIPPPRPGGSTVRTWSARRWAGPGGRGAWRHDARRRRRRRRRGLCALGRPPLKVECRAPGAVGRERAPAPSRAAAPAAGAVPGPASRRPPRGGPGAPLDPPVPPQTGAAGERPGGRGGGRAWGEGRAGGRSRRGNGERETGRGVLKGWSLFGLRV